MGAILEHLLTRGGTGSARVVLAVNGIILAVRTDPIEVVGMPGGTIEYANGRRRAAPGPLARSGLIDYTMVWPGAVEPKEENRLGIFDLVRAAPGYQVIWSPGGQQKDGTPRGAEILTTTHGDGDIYIGVRSEPFRLYMLIRLWSLVGDIDGDLDLDEGLRKRLGG